MPFPIKIQPIDIDSDRFRIDMAPKPVIKSSLRRLFDQQFFSVHKTSLIEKPPAAAGDVQKDVGAIAVFEPSSVCLAKMVQNFIEERNEKPIKCGRNRCNCFNGNNDSSEDELDFFTGYASNILKIVEASKTIKQKDELTKLVTGGLVSLGYDSSVCKSKWDKSPSFPAGEYEYIDVIVEGERLLIDIDFRSEFEVARPTGAYKAVLQSLPFIFVGKSDRLGQIVSIVTEAARQSLKKKGMPFPPWRKTEYLRAKWLSPSPTRSTAKSDMSPAPVNRTGGSDDRTDHLSQCGEFELIFGDEAASNLTDPSPGVEAKVNGNSTAVVLWTPPAVKPKSVERGARIVTGLASLLAANP